MPVTTTSIIRLKPSRTRPSGTTNNPGNSIQFRAGAASSFRAKIRQAPAKLASTAAQDKKLLSPFDRRVKTTINADAISGANKTYQAMLLSITESEFQTRDVFDVRRLPGPKERDDNGKADSNFSRSHSDDEENKHLRVVIGQAGVHSKSREGNERKICGVQHQLQTHENDDDVATQHDAGEADREKQAANNQVVSESNHVIAVRVCSTRPRRWSRPRRGRR